MKTAAMACCSMLSMARSCSFCMRPFHNARGKIYAMKDDGDHLEVVRERTDLDTP